MSKPTSIDICNVALGQLGHSQIRDFDEKNGKMCKRFYDFDLRWLLSRYDWSFARKRAKLQRLVTAESDTNFAYAYQIPSDCLAPRALYPGGSKARWEVYGTELHTDITIPYLVYTRHATNTSHFTSIFADLLSYRVAIKLAQALGSDKAMRRELKSEYEIEYEIGTLEDAEIGSNHRYPDTDPDNDTWGGGGFETSSELSGGGY